MIKTARVMALGLTVAGLAFGGAARAACSDAKMPYLKTSSQTAGFHLSDAVYHPGDGRMFLVGEHEGADIVGFWTFEWRAKADPQLPNNNPMIPDGALLDFGLIQWHDDGTEITNSGGRTPAVGDVCMGAWKQVGPSTYQLTHLALGYGPPPGPAGEYSGLALLEMQVTVDKGGHSYHGNFVLTQFANKFDPSVPGSEFDQSTVEFTLSGGVKAKRVEAN